jgi:hypothetical protein
VLRYHLLPLWTRTGTEDGAWFPVAERTKWSAVVDVAFLSPGGSVTVTLEASPTGEEATARTLGSAIVVAATGTTTKDAAFLGVKAYDGYLRARVTAIAGTAVLRVTAEAPFVDGSDPKDQALLSKEVRGLSEVVALVSAAEDDVVARLVTRSAVGPVANRPFTPDVVGRPFGEAESMDGAARGSALALDLAQPGAATAVRSAVVRQAEHRFRRGKLEQNPDPAALVTLRSLPELSPEASVLLDPFRPIQGRRFRGRG